MLGGVSEPSTLDLQTSDFPTDSDKSLGKDEVEKQLRSEDLDGGIAVEGLRQQLEQSFRQEEIAMAANQRGMPRRGERGAPEFTGEAGSLLRYFADVAACCEELGVMGVAEKKKYLVRYADRLTEETWKSLPEYDDATKSLEDFKKAVITLFPGVDTERKYGMGLEEEWRRRGIKTQAELGEFHQAFVRILTFLLAKDRLLKAEVERSYLQSFGPELRKKIVDRLCIIDQEHHLDDPFATSVVYKAAGHLLFGTPSGVGGSGGASAERTLGSGATVKQEEVSSFQMLANMLKETLILVASAQAQAAWPPPVTIVPRPSFGPAAGMQPQRPSGCIFCGGDHFIRDCAESTTYIAKGLAGKNTLGQVCLPNGYYVPRGVPGLYLKERIDNYHAMQQGGGASGGLSRERDPPPHLSANLLELTKMSAGATIEEVFDDEIELERLQALVMAAEKKVAGKKGGAGGKKVKFDSSADKDGKDSKAVEKGKADATPPPTKSVTPFKPSYKSADSAPQFHYILAAEDLAVVNKVFNRMLDSELKMMNREVLAISNEVRKGVKELVQTKKVSGAGGATVEMLFNSGAGWAGDWAGGDAVVMESLPLRTIDGVLDGKIKCELVLDGGAQFVAIRKDVWKALGIARMTDKTVTLEAANKMKSQTLGVANFKLQVGPIMLAVQAHVVESAPFEVLLGWPFYVITSCVTRDSVNGGVGRDARIDGIMVVR